MSKRTNLTAFQKGRILERLAAVVESDMETDALYEDAEKAGATDRKAIDVYVRSVAMGLSKRAANLLKTGKGWPTPVSNAVERDETP